MLVLGRAELEANSEVVLSSFNTFCSLCSKEIKKDTVVFKSKDEVEENTYFIHTMCEVETGVHKVYYQKEVKKKGGTKKKVKPKKKIHKAEKDTTCQFCRKTIKKDNEWVGNGQGRKSKKYHPDCWKRYQKVLAATRNSLRR